METNYLDPLKRLFCTFCQQDQVDNTINFITSRYTLLHNKIFILESPQTNEFICTYNIDTGNMNGNIPNTILMHRKKDYNTLYSINALNTLIMSLNNGKIDINYIIDWKEYKNCILLTDKNNGLRRLDTKVNQIVEI